MAYIIETPNPFEPLKDARKHAHPGGISVWDWLRQTYPGFEEFDHPTVCLINGKALLRKDWGTQIGSDDIVNFVVIPQGAVTLLVVSIVLAVASIALTFVVGMPKTPGETPASDPVFSNNGKNNTIRLGEPIECPYGRNRLFPSLASRPFFQYRDNNQFQFALYCIGQGEYEIDTVQIGDTAATNFVEVEYEVIPPGSNPTLFPTNVYTSAEAGGQTLFGPNESAYVAPGWVGPFPANEAGTQTNQIQIDLVWPQGVYFSSKSGKLKPITLLYQLQAREIDDSGNPVGSYFYLNDPLETYSFTAATNTPQRRTVIADVPIGRYEVRARRTDNILESHRTGYTTIWESLRAVLVGDQIDFGNVTLLAMKVRASDNLNERTQSRVNVICTRKLPIWESGGGFSAPVATRSIVWAAVDVFRSQYGGRITDDVFFDYEALEALDLLYASREEYFDWNFRDSITVWEAAQAIARVGRAVPLLVGSLISMKRDGPLETPVTLFGPDNMVQGSFEWNVKLWDLDEYDSVSVEYTEPSTGYKQEQVICTLPGGTTDNPQQIRIPGIQSRAHAYHEGLYIAATQRYLRENVVFQTGMEGFVATYGDLIAVSHDLPRWGQSGYVVHAQAEVGDDYRLWVSEPLVWTESGTYQILLRGSKGEVIGPVTAFETTDSQQVIVRIPGGMTFQIDGTTEPTLFLFGVEGAITEYVKVVKIDPQGGEVVQITAVNNSSIIHSFDELEPPALDIPALPPEVPDLPTVTNVYLSQLDATLLIVQVGWTASFGAQYYVVEISEDEGATWQSKGITERTSIQFQAFPGTLDVRVAAVNTGQGAWTTASMVVSLITGLEAITPWEALDLTVRWTSVLTAAGYRAYVYDNSASAPILVRTEDVSLDATTYTYDYTKALTDGVVVRELVVAIDTLVEDDDVDALVPDGAPKELEFSNAVPVAPTAPSSSPIGEDSTGMRYTLSWTNPEDDDLISVKIWLSPSMGFDPEATTPEVEEVASAIGHANVANSVVVVIPLDSTGAHPTYYWRVAVFDVWGEEILGNITAEQTIAAYT